MSLTSYLDRLRAEPEEKRQRVVWIATIAITLVIAGLWLLSWRLSGSEAPATVATSTSSGWVESLVDIKYRIVTGWQSLKTN